MVERRIVPTSAIDISDAKRARGNVSIVVPVGGGSEVFTKAKGSGKAGRGGYVIVRGTHVKSGHKLGSKAKALKDCAGEKGAEFKNCVVKALGKAPRSLKNL
jgi:hypothetical protein